MLPLQRIGDADPLGGPAVSPTRTDAMKAVAERPLRILAAEDNATNRSVLQALLEPADVELTSSPTAARRSTPGAAAASTSS